MQRVQHWGVFHARCGAGEGRRIVSIARCREDVTCKKCLALMRKENREKAARARWEREHTRVKAMKEDCWGNHDYAIFVDGNISPLGIDGVYSYDSREKAEAVLQAYLNRKRG